MIAAPDPPPSVSVCRPSPQGSEVARGQGVRLWVRTVGTGTPVVYIPSLGRGAADFDAVAVQMARRGFMAVLPEPRGTGRSAGPAPTSLEDLSGDVEAVIRARCRGPVHLVGHAFGNRLARLVATDAPALVADVALLAGGGEVQPTEAVRAALRTSTAEGEAPDAARLDALRIAFFAKGSDASVWLRGWWPAVARAQVAAGPATRTARWWKAGAAPVFLLQAAEDPIAPPANGLRLKADIGPRLSLATLRHASHAILPEQPAAVVAGLAAYFGGERREDRLQAAVDAATRDPS